MPEVKLVNVTKKYGRIIANDSINLTISDREYVSVIGPSGCGKTTLIKNIAGIIKPDEGEILIDGKLVSNIAIEDITPSRDSSPTSELIITTSS